MTRSEAELIRDSLTVRQLVATGIASKTTINRWVNETDKTKPHLPSYKIGNSRRIARADWIAFLRAHVYEGKP